MTKSTFFSEMIQELPRAFAQVLAGSVATAGGIGLYALARSVHDSITKKKQIKAYKEMHKFFPEIQNIPEIHRKTIFRTVAGLNPELMTDPWVAGSLVSRIYAAQYITPDLITQLTRAEPPAVGLSPFLKKKFFG